MIYNLRGCNGAGKTYVVHEILKQYTWSYVEDPSIDEIVATWVPDLNVMLVGYYDPHTLGTGGCDWYLAGNGGSTKTVWDLEKLLVKLTAAFPTRNLLFEGFMISGTFGRWIRFAQQVKPITFLCLDTPREVCIDHIRGRRLRKGNTKPFDGSNVMASHRQVQRAYDEIQRAGCLMQRVNYVTAPEEVHRILRGH